MQAYSDPKRADDPHALPDVETWYHDHSDGEGPECLQADAFSEGECGGSGWYWWSCFPGCLPDGDPVGPFETEAEALADAQDGEA